VSLTFTLNRPAEVADDSNAAAFHICEVPVEDARWLLNLKAEGGNVFATSVGIFQHSIVRLCIVLRSQ
jgi:hypothetical protein